MQVLLELTVLVLMFLFLRNAGWTWILAIPILFGLLLFSQGLGLMLSILNARFGDVQYIVAVVLGALYFLTPVLYPMSMIEGQSDILGWVIKLNPMSWYVEAMHDAMYSLVAPSPTSSVRCSWAALLSSGSVLRCSIVAARTSGSCFDRVRR